jgi:putative ABC transport system permease protein
VAFDLSKMPKLRWLNPLGRLKEGVSIEQAQAEMDVISGRFEQIDPEANKGWKIQVVPLREWAVSGDRETLYLLMGAVGFILLIACANVANLLLARAASRQKEIAVRASMGADRQSLLRQLLTESVVLAVLGGVLGVIAGLIGIRIFVAMAPTWFYGDQEVSIDLVVLAFTLGISLLAAFLFGLLPALQASKPDLHNSLKEGGRSSRVSGGRSRKILVVAEVALALVLLVGAGLMTNSFLRLQQVDPGFDPKNILLAKVTLAGTDYWYGSAERRSVTPQGVVFFNGVLERMRALPGVLSAGTANGAPPGNGYSNPIEIVGRAPTSDGDPLRVRYCEVSPGFLETLGIPLLKGRYLTEQDVEGSPWVVVINEAMAEELFPNEEPLGKSLYMSMAAGGAGTIHEERPREIVGVVGDVKRWSLRWGQRPLMYGSHEQHVWEYPGGRYVAHVSKDFVIRTATNPMSLAREIRRIVTEVDPNQTVYNVRTMEQALSQMVAPQRFWMQLYGIFALLALILAAIGIYGVMSYSVNERTHEIGVRMAVGAQTGTVLKLVITQGLKLTFLGTAIGILGGFGLTRLISSYLFGVTPTDPLTYIVVSLFLAIIAVAACAFPARRAAKVDPLTALRYE